MVYDYDDVEPHRFGLARYRHRLNLDRAYPMRGYRRRRGQRCSVEMGYRLYAGALMLQAMGLAE